MRVLSISAVTASMFVSGCIDDSEDPFGVLPIPGIQGLSYETQTQSGSLNDSQFKYLEGETVSIKLGSQVLLTFEAEAEIPLAALTSQLPETEDELYSAYFDEDVYQEFQLAANFMQLIYNLDADGNPDNGFDLTQYVDIDASLSLDLTVSPNEFYDTELLELASVLNSQRMIAPVRSIGDLFTLFDQPITLELQLQKTTDSDNDGAVDQVTDYEYNDNGLVTVNKTDNNMDSISDRKTEYSYSSLGLYTGYQYASDTDSDGTANSSNSEQRSYNAFNLLEQKDFGADHGGDGVYDFVTNNIYSYDAAGRVVIDVYSTANNSDGIYDSITTSEYSYNENGDISSKVEKEDHDASGSTDTTKTHTYTYNEQNLLTEYIRSDDDDSDGTEEDRIVQTYTYDDAGNMLTEFQGNYTSDVLGFNKLVTFEYNENGDKTEELSITDYTGDDQVNYKYSDSREYDDSGRLISQLSRVYQDGSNLSKQLLYTYEYDGQNNRTVQKKEEDENLDGSYDSTEINTYTYTDSGNVASQLMTEDENNDGTSETISTYLYTYTQNVNGHRALLGQYEVSYY